MSVSQPATFDEIWTDERISNFLLQQAPAGESADFYVLYTAYKHMRIGDFITLLTQFKAAGRDVHATNAAGKSVLDLIATHAQSQAFADSLRT